MSALRGGLVSSKLQDRSADTAAAGSVLVHQARRRPRARARGVPNERALVDTSFDESGFVYFNEVGPDDSGLQHVPVHPEHSAAQLRSTNNEQLSAPGCRGVGQGRWLGAAAAVAPGFQ